MRRVTIVIILLMAIPLGTNGFGQDGDEKDKANETLNGEWNVLSFTIDGYEIKPTNQKPIKVSFINDQMVTKLGFWVRWNTDYSWGKGGFSSNTQTFIVFTQNGRKGTFHLNRTKNPAEIDLKEENDDKTTMTKKGIYKISGDELVLCIDNRTRPTEFKQSSSTAVLINLVRNNNVLKEK